MTLDLTMLEEVELRPDEFVYLECQRLKKDFSLLKVEATDLEKKGYIKITDSGIILRKKYLDLVETDEDRCWREFCNTYPFKVNTGKGNRILHTADPDAFSNQKVKKKYLSIIKGKPTLHRQIVKATEIMLERERRNLAYLQNLTTYVNNFGWEKYFHELTEDTEQESKPIYGGAIK